jgi:hypothetical protein
MLKVLLLTLTLGTCCCIIPQGGAYRRDVCDDRRRRDDTGHSRAAPRDRTYRYKNSYNRRLEDLERENRTLVSVGAVAVNRRAAHAWM